MAAVSMDREERLRRRREQARLRRAAETPEQREARLARTETIREALILPCNNRSGHATLHTNHSHLTLIYSCQRHAFNSKLYYNLWHKTTLLQN